MPFLMFFLSPIGRYVIVAALIGAALFGLYAKGYHDGSAKVQAKWDAAEQAGIARGDAARRDAERDVDRGVSDDKFDRH